MVHDHQPADPDRQNHSRGLSRVDLRPTASRCRVVAIDADTSFGKLVAQVDPHEAGSDWDLAADDHLDTVSDVRTKVGTNADVARGSEEPPPSWHRLGPLHMPVEAQRCRHGAVAIPDGRRGLRFEGQREKRHRLGAEERPGRHGGRPDGVAAACRAATGALAVGAFILSFVVLRDLAVIAGIRPGLAPVLPLVIDLAIGVATLALVAIGDKPARRTRNATRSAGATAAPGAITAISKRSAPTATLAVAAMTDRENATASATESAVPSADGPNRELAAELVAEKATRQSVETVAAILAAYERGDPLNRIAKHIGVHHSAVSRVIDAAAAHRQRTLEVV